MSVRSFLRLPASILFPLVLLLAAGCGSDKPDALATPTVATDSPALPVTRPVAYKKVLWADDITVAQEKLREAQTPFEQVLPRLEERPLYNYVAFVDEARLAARFGAKKSISSVDSKLRRMFNYRILKIARGGGEVRLYFLETIPFTREYLLEEKMGPNHNEAKSQLARVLITFDPALATEQIAEKLKAEFVEFDSLAKPFRTRTGEVDVEFYPPVKAGPSTPACGATLVKTSAQVMADYKKAVTDKVVEMLDAQEKSKEKKQKKSLDY